MTNSIAKKPTKNKRANKPSKGTEPARKNGVAKARGHMAQSPAQRAPKAATAKKPAQAGRVSKVARILELLKRPGGVCLRELTEATGWKPHSVRGFLSGTVRKKMGIPVESVKDSDRERSYRIPSK